VWGAELVFDGTNVRANADIDSLVPRWSAAAKAHVDGLCAGDGDAVAAPDGEAAPAPPAAPASPAAVPPSAASPRTRLPCRGTSEAERDRAARNTARWTLLDTWRLNPDRPPSGAYQRITDRRVSTTDPDAAPLRVGGEPRLGYHDHYMVDGGKARIMLAALVTPADVQDNQALLELLDRARFRYHLHVQCVIGDSTYATGANLRQLAERDIRASMPVVDYEQSSPVFRHADFIDDAAPDSYRGPNGATLT
jgi:hypothetical protein